MIIITIIFIIIFSIILFKSFYKNLPLMKKFSSVKENTEFFLISIQIESLPFFFNQGKIHLFAIFINFIILSLISFTLLFDLISNDITFCQDSSGSEEIEEGLGRDSMSSEEYSNWLSNAIKIRDNFDNSFETERDQNKIKIHEINDQTIEKIYNIVEIQKKYFTWFTEKISMNEDNPVMPSRFYMDSYKNLLTCFRDDKYTIESIRLQIVIDNTVSEIKNIPPKNSLDISEYDKILNEIENQIDANIKNLKDFYRFFEWSCVDSSEKSYDSQEEEKASSDYE